VDVLVVKAGTEAPKLGEAISYQAIKPDHVVTA
jgi:hypothetical protein